MRLDGKYLIGGAYMAKKTITIEIDEDAFNGLNNAVIAYMDIVYACFLHCEVDSKFEKLKELPEEKLFARRDKLVDMYKQIEQQFLN